MFDNQPSDDTNAAIQLRLRQLEERAQYQTGLQASPQAGISSADVVNFTSRHGPGLDFPCPQPSCKPTVIL